MENKKMTKEDFILKCGYDLAETLKKSKVQLANQHQQLLIGKMQLIIKDALFEGVELTTQEILELAQQTIKKEFEMYVSIAFEFYSPEWIEKKKTEEKARLEALNKKEEKAEGHQK